MKLAAVLKSSAWLALVLAACSGATEEDSASHDAGAGAGGTGSYGGGGGCSGYPGDCFYTCPGSGQPSCVNGQWKCSSEDWCPNPGSKCTGTECVQSCGFCAGGEWQCATETTCDGGVAPDCESFDETSCLAKQERGECSPYYAGSPSLADQTYVGCGELCVQTTVISCALDPAGACWILMNKCVLPDWTLLEDCEGTDASACP